MSAVLEAVREELGVVRRRVRCLEQAESLLVPVYEPEAPQRAVRASRPAKRVRRWAVSSGSPSTARVRDYVVAHGPLTRGEVIAAMDGKGSTVGDKLRSLVAAGELVTSGEKGAYQYSAPSAGGGEVAPAVLEAVSVPGALPERGVYPMFDAIVDSGGSSTQQLAGVLGVPSSVVVEQGRRLVQLGLVRFMDSGSGRVWRPSEREKVGGAS